MFTNPNISEKLVRDRQREMYAQADRQRLACQARARVTVPRRPAPCGQLRRVLRRALRLQTEVRI